MHGTQQRLSEGQAGLHVSKRRAPARLQCLGRGMRTGRALTTEWSHVQEFGLLHCCLAQFCWCRGSPELHLPPAGSAAALHPAHGCHPPLVSLLTSDSSGLTYIGQFPGLGRCLSCVLYGHLLPVLLKLHFPAFPLHPDRTGSWLEQK